MNATVDGSAQPMLDRAGDVQNALLTLVSWACLAVPLLIFIPSVAQAALVVADVAFVALCCARKTLPRPAWMLPVLLFAGYGVVNGALGVAPAVSMGAAAAWLRFPVFVAAVSEVYARRRAMFNRMFYAWAAVAAFGVVDVFVQKTLGVDLFGQPTFGDPSIGMRLTGPFSKPMIGIVLTFIAWPAVVYLMSRRASAAVIGVAAWVAAVAVSGERMALLLCLFGLFGVLLFRARRRLRMAAVCAGVFATLYAGLLSVDSGFRLRQTQLLHEFGHADTSIYTQVFAGGVAVFGQHPVFGVGLHAYRYACPNLAGAGASTVCTHLHPHQFWIESLAESGLIGTGLLLWMLHRMLRPAVGAAAAALRERQTVLNAASALQAGATVSVLLRLWPLSVTGSFFSSYNALIFWSMAACAIAAAHQGKKPASQEVSQ